MFVEIVGVCLEFLSRGIALALDRFAERPVDAAQRGKRSSSANTSGAAIGRSQVSLVRK
jgi:hypothetical protein